jgi:uncharacterized membrane protein YfcA
MAELVWPGLVLLGLVVGAFGTLIGAGGGFILVPLLLLLYPSESPELITSISLAVVFFNALSGSVAYLRQRRVDLLAGNVFALATVPGAIGGSLAVSFLPRRLFDLVFAVVLLAVSAFLVLRPPSRIVHRRSRRSEVSRMLTDVHGDTYGYSFSLPLGVAISLLVGFISSLLGVGGGVIHVPAMVQVLHFPTHVATATSQYVLTVTALVGSVVHILAGHFDEGYRRTAALTLGVVIGAQVGARLSSRLPAAVIVRLLALALVAVAARLVFAAFD